jgi:hypothetical protein
MYNLGVLLANQWDPPQLDQARTWWEKAADAETTSAMYNLSLLQANRWDPPQLDQARTWYGKGGKEGPPHGTSAPGVTGLIAVMRRIDAARPAAQRGHATPAGRSPALDLREPDSAAWTHRRRDLCYLEMVMLSCRLGTSVHLDHEFVLRRMRRRPQELSEARRRHGRHGQPGRRDESRR